MLTYWNWILAEYKSEVFLLEEIKRARSEILRTQFLRIHVFWYMALCQWAHGTRSVGTWHSVSGYMA